MSLDQSIRFMLENTHPLNLSEVNKIASKAKSVSNCKTQKKPIAQTQLAPLQDFNNLTKFGQKLHKDLNLIHSSPFFTGLLDYCKYAPHIEQFFHNISDINCDFVYSAPVEIEKRYTRFQYYTQTDQFGQSCKLWADSQNKTSKDFDVFAKQLFKHYQGVDIVEVEVNISTHLTLRQTQNLQNSMFDQEAIKSLVQKIKETEMKRLVGVCSKLEVTVRGDYTLRILFFLGLKFIDGYRGFIHPNFDELKSQFINLDTANINCKPYSLKGYLPSTIIFSQIGLSKQYLKQLKTYLIESESLVRVGGNLPTFKIWYIN